MAKRTKNDELNILDYHDYIEHYFDPMQIDEKQRRERIEEAEEIFDAIMLFLIWCDESPENVKREDTQRDMENLYREVIFQKVEPDEFIDIYVPFFIGNLVEVTTENINDKYYTSVDRAANIACNEANTVINYAEVQQAKEQGYLFKKWQAEVDNRTRLDHISMDGVTIPIDAYFIFDDCEMFVPHDEVNGTARQCVNCRCSVKFLKGNDNRRFDDVTDTFKIKNETFDVQLNSSFTDRDGNTYYIDNKHVYMDYTEHEYEIAKLIKAKLGGEISIVPKVVSPSGVRTPDYIFRGENLDLKEIHSSKQDALYNAVHRKSRQASNFVFDITKSELPTEDFIKQMESLYSRTHTRFVDKTILIRDNEIIKILQKRNPVRPKE